MIGAQIIFLVIPDLYHSKVYENSVLGSYNHLVLTMLLTIILLGSFKVQQGIQAIIKNGFFNPKSVVKFKQAGMILILFTFLRVVYIIIIKSEFKLNELINNSILAFLVLLVGIGLLIFSDFIKNGGVLQEENDLTI
ncbi:MAG: DUF2975 domain-containing protein [Flavobacteriaceae bacterium]|nr:DUF2975 domain-containing protein [Flavobacteriaceae bacterium]